MPAAWWALAVTLGIVCLLGVSTVANAPYRQPWSGYLAILLIGLQWLVAVAGVVASLVLWWAAPDAAPARGN